MKSSAIAVLLLFLPIVAYAEDSKILQIVGPTMGTKYTVKVFKPSEMNVDPDDAQILLDGLLRRINDQMSTYLKTSEITKFNQSDSIEWFPVSPDLAKVVHYSQSVSEKTDGAFDITVGPLVNAWNFGPEPRTAKPPAEEVLNELREYVGYDKLAVRLEPPALKKAHPKLQIDLSAVAKGFAVDQVVQMLAERGAENVFVEIGGEVATAGNKDGQWWKVGIQLPDAKTDAVMIAHALNTGSGDDRAMATSGDYRNYFESDGIRYSHTIDPASGRPITHTLASVSVVAESCMVADAWATALNVMGPTRAEALAEESGLDVLLVNRKDDGFDVRGTGTLKKYATLAVDPALGDPQPGEELAGNNMLAVLGITFVAFAVILFGMAIGVIFGRRSISGSCGGLANTKNDDGSVSCSLCSNPDNACKELRQRMQGSV